MTPENLDRIQKKIETTTRQASRKPEEVRLIAVVKGQPSEKIQEALQLGQKDFGENYAQEMTRHIEEIRKGGSPWPPSGGHEPPLWGQPQRVAPTWHFIGHLQKNKVRLVMDHVDLIHSLDSLPLAQEINKRAHQIGKTQSVLIEVNLAQEKSKSGILESEVEKLVSSLNDLASLNLIGLMTMPPAFENPEDARPFFRRLREIRDAINQKNLYKHPLTHLSMGMSQDFEIAIEEGATFIRIGTALFGKRS